MYGKVMTIMPNRIIKESAFTSDKIASLSDFEFRLWVGLITQADDAGRGDARPAIIKGRVFALRERVTLKDIDSALHTLAAHSCVSLYTVGGKPYYAFPNWAAHQRVRDVKPKYPGADEADNLRKSAADCGELPQNAALIQSNPIQSNPNPESNPFMGAGAPEKGKKKFIPPTLDEIRAYVKKRNSPVDPQTFFDYFEAGGWKDSEGKPVLAWKQKLITWEKHGGGNNRGGNSWSGSAKNTGNSEQTAKREYVVHYD